ncbi:helix-turn-helix domain-containing protein [Streptomyces sp. NBC_01462]|uniref:AraC-like ligand-binding domain-containing protein n=1 Tax=Streptomyces sp. NBC_01462 TaxID=2903876 RepID=UPI002E358DA4|nr:helix-turn-helix domain-containing protein [Streptomyces sp. NBC_01462]
MLKTVFRSATLPAAERLAGFDEFLSECAHPLRVTTSDAGCFRATARALDIGPVNVVELTLLPSVLRRTTRSIRRSDPELYSVVFPRRGILTVRQAGRDAVLSGDDFALCDSSQPFSVRIAAPGTATLISAKVPRALLPLSVRRADRLLGTRLPGGEGIGALLTQFLGNMTADTAHHPTADVARLSAVALDLLAATLAHHLDAGPRGEDESGRQSLLLHIDTYIQDHLPEPHLSPRVVAAAHHISVSYLHRLFRARETTVTALIRRRRLERAHRDLTDRRLRNVPVHRIASRWGFKDHSAFTRAFRAAYGIPPSDLREPTLGFPAAPVDIPASVDSTPRGFFRGSTSRYQTPA